MKSSTAYTTSHSCAVLLVGEPKTGKTNLMFAFPSLWIADLDLNLASAVRRAPGTSFFFDQPALLDDGKERPVEQRWNELVKLTKAAIVDPQIRTIAIDGLGVLVEYLIAHIIAEGRKAGTNKTGKMELQNYGDLARLLRDYIMMLRASGKFIIVTSHQAADRDEVTGALRYYLAIPGQSKETLGGLFTDVWATATRPGAQVKYEIRTKPTGFHVALGTSFKLDAAIDVTDKTPSQIWAILEPQISPKPITAAKL